MTAIPDPTVPAQAREAVDADPDAGDLLAPDSDAPGMPSADPGYGDTGVAEHPVGGDSPLDPTKGATPPTEQH